MISRGVMGILRACTLRIALLLLVLPGDSEAQEVAVPVETHLPLLAKVLEYDRAFAPKGRQMVVLGVIYQSSWRPSAAVFDEVVAVTSRASFAIRGLTVQVVPLDASGNPDMRELLTRSPIDVVYIAPVRGLSMEEITRTSEAKQRRTITGVPEFVEEGVAIAIGLRNSRPLIVVNLPAAKACGADLSAQVLRLARVVE